LQKIFYEYIINLEKGGCMKKLVFFISLSLLILVGCEQRYKYTTWINPDVRCCEVEDPLNNLKWLNSVYSKSYTYGSQVTTLSYSYYYFIYVFKNDSTNEEFVVTKEDLNNSSKPTFALYSCDGKIIDKGYYQDYDSEYANPDIQFVAPTYYETEPCYSCDDFFRNHTLVDTIAYIYTNDFIR
jgi:hypothetical protein